MRLTIRKYRAALFGVLFLASLVPLLLPLVADPPRDPFKQELFDPRLSNLNTDEKLLTYIDSIYGSPVIQQSDTDKYVRLVSKTIIERFYFGLSTYSLSDNWIAFLAGKILWAHLSAIVDPHDLLKHQNGLCSQQSIVFMEVLKHKGIRERSIGLGYKEGPGHFLTEVFYDGSWHLHDVTMEPEWKNITHHNNSISYYLHNKDSLYLVYKNLYTKPLFGKLLENVSYGKINEFPAGRMLFFHKATYIFTYILPLLFLYLFISSIRFSLSQSVHFKNKTESKDHYQTEK